MNYKVEYNKAIEFISSIYKYSRNKQQEVSWNTNEIDKDISKGLLDFSPSKDVKEWLNYVDDNISPFLKNDIVLLSRKMFDLLDGCIKLIIDNNLSDYSQLIETIKAMDGSELIKVIYETFDLDLPLETEDKLIKEKLAELYSEEMASYFIQAKNCPKEYKSKVIEVFEAFYKLYYKPFEDKVYKFMEERCKAQNEMSKNNFLEFVNTIGLGDYSKFISEGKKLRLFVSFYIDNGQHHFYIDDTFIISYGYTAENRLNSKAIQDKSRALFKALSDDKRLEIIKITSKRPWYNKELADYFDLSTATLSYHLNLLLDLEILNFEPSINNRYYYTTNRKNLEKLFDMALKDIFE